MVVHSLCKHAAVFKGCCSMTLFSIDVLIELNTIRLNIRGGGPS